ncbi:MAG: hypothetical protein RIQ62_1617 [Bacteroidota bacterium]|jgi:uncharacterized membrane protein
MNNRPKIELELTLFDKALEILGWISVLVIWILVITNYITLPDSIPIHYNSMGVADRFGGKENILTLPIVATVLFIGLTMLNKFPHLFNYPTPITEDNALRQYTYATRLLRYLKFIILVIFGAITWQTISNVHNIGIWFLPMTVALMLIPFIYFLIKSLNSTKQ